MKRISGLLFASAVAAVAAGCSGGSAATGLPVAGGAPSSHKTTHARLRISVSPQKHRKKIRVHGHYISPATASLTYTVSPALAGGATSGEVDISTSNPACQTTGVVGYLTCTIDITGVVPGTPYTFAFTTWDAAGGSGNQLSANDNVPFTANAGQSNVLQATLGGIASSLVMTPISARGITGSVTAFNVYGHRAVKFAIVPMDAQENFIIGPGAPQPVASLAPGASAVLSAVGSSSPNEWSLTSSFVATNPTVPSITSIVTSATPVPGSGGSTVSATIGLSLYQPWVYAIDGSSLSNIRVFDEDGNAISSPPTFNNVGPVQAAVGIAYGNNQLYFYSNYVGGSTAKITAFSPLGGNALASISGADNGDLGSQNYAAGIAVSSQTGNVYVVSSGTSNTKVMAFDPTLTTETANIASVAAYGVTYVPQTQQIAFPSAFGGVQLCDEALTTCSSFGSELNADGIAYDESSQLLGFGVADCCGSHGGIQLATVGGTFGTAIGAGLSMTAVAFDPYNGLWYGGYQVDASHNGINAYTESGTQNSTFASWTPTSIVNGIAIVP